MVGDEYFYWRIDGEIISPLGEPAKAIHVEMINMIIDLLLIAQGFKALLATTQKGGTPAKIMHVAIEGSSRVPDMQNKLPDPYLIEETHVLG